SQPMVRHKMAYIGYEPQREGTLGKLRLGPIQKALAQRPAVRRPARRRLSSGGPSGGPRRLGLFRPCGPTSYFWEFLAAFPHHSRLQRALRDLSPTSAVPSTFHNANGSPNRGSGTPNHA
ncbi:MAG: hypothetical protein ACUVTW_12500, partial [Thermogutta sp.]